MTHVEYLTSRALPPDRVGKYGVHCSLPTKEGNRFAVSADFNTEDEAYAAIPLLKSMVRDVIAAEKQTEDIEFRFID